MKQKYKYRVFFRRIMESESPENCFNNDEQFAGDTFAVSEAQAINNVRHRVFGDISQYLPVVSYGKYELFYEWRAEKAWTLPQTTISAQKHSANT